MMRLQARGRTAFLAAMLIALQYGLSPGLVALCLPIRSPSAKPIAAHPQTMTTFTTKDLFPAMDVHAANTARMIKRWIVIGIATTNSVYAMSSGERVQSTAVGAGHLSWDLCLKSFLADSANLVEDLARCPLRLAALIAISSSSGLRIESLLTAWTFAARLTSTTSGGNSSAVLRAEAFDSTTRSDLACFCIADRTFQHV